MIHRGLLIFLCLLLVSTSACSTLGSLNPFSADKAVELAPETSSAAAEQNPIADLAEAPTTAVIEDQPEALAAVRPPSEPIRSSSVELLWQVPGEAVERYYIRYGLSELRLDQQVIVPVRELQKLDDPVNGPLFRYVLKGVPEIKTVYFTIQAENQYGLSPTSPVQKVDAK